MKKNLKNYYILACFITILLMPVIVFAEGKSDIVDKFKLSKEKFHITTTNNNPSNYKPANGYEKILNISDYIYIQTNSGYIKKLTHEFEEVDELPVNSNKNTQMVGNYIYTIYTNYENSTYYINFNKYDNNFELLVEKRLSKTFSKSISYIRYICYQNNHYITYQFDSKYYLMILDQNGDILVDTDISSDIILSSYDYKFIVLNDKLYLTTPTVYSNDYKSTIYSVTKNGDITEEKTINNYEINDITQDKNGTYAAVGYHENNKSYILKLDKDFNIIKRVDYESSINDSSDIDLNTKRIYSVNNSYILLGKKLGESRRAERTVLFIYDSNLNYQYEIDYDDYAVLLNGTGDSEIYVDKNDLYVVSVVGYSGYTPNSGGLILKYILDSYNVDTEIKEGKGTIESNYKSALPGEDVTFTANPEIGYELKELKVITITGKEIKYRDNKFTMPDEDVIIQAKFEKKLSIPTINPETSSGLAILVFIAFILGTITFIKTYRKKY